MAAIMTWRLVGTRLCHGNSWMKEWSSRSFVKARMRVALSEKIPTSCILGLIHGLVCFGAQKLEGTLEERVFDTESDTIERCKGRRYYGDCLDKETRE